MQQDIKSYAKSFLQSNEQIDISVLNWNKNSRLNIDVSPEEKHRHDQMELLYIISGKIEAEMEVGLNSIVLNEGELLIVKENMLHALYYTENVTALVIHLNYEDLAKEYEEKDIFFRQVISGDSLIQETFNQIYIEFESKKEGFWLICKGLINCLMAHLIRNYADIILDDKEAIKQKNKRIRLLEALKYIEEHYNEPIKCKELAELIHLSEDRFQHLFKEGMGVSLQKYINKIGMTKAARLLKSGMFTASEVAEKVGFQDYNSFGRIFRSTYGCAPSQLVKNQNELSEVL